MTFTAEYNGVSFIFDPIRQAVKDTGIKYSNPLDPILARKILEYKKTGKQRAETGAKLLWARKNLTPRQYKDYLSRWKSSLIRRVTSCSKSLVFSLTCDSSERIVRR